MSVAYYHLEQIDLGKDEAEQDARLHEYFLRTGYYRNALEGRKTLIIGRKGSGKSAIFILMQRELGNAGKLVIPITPDQYAWTALKDYREKGILPEHAHTNSWKLTLLTSIIWKLNERNLVGEDSRLREYYKYMQDAYVPSNDNWFHQIVSKGKQILSGVKTQWVSFEFQPGSSSTPLRIIDETQRLLLREWPKKREIRIVSIVWTTAGMPLMSRRWPLLAC